MKDNTITFLMTNADGTTTEYTLSGKWGVTSAINFGSPPIEYQTQDYFQADGQQVLNYRLQPRAMGISIVRDKSDDWSQYWTDREAILEALRPNYVSPTQMIITRSDGKRRALYIRPEPGLAFDSDDDSVSINQVMTLTAHDPVWFNPDSTSVSFSTSTDEDLIFPATFPIKFGNAGTTYDSGDLAYAGSWETFPILTLTGPYQTATITNLGIGVSLNLVTEIVDGETRTIDFRPSTRDVYDQDGNSAWSDLSVNSNLKDFKIQPTNLLTATQQISVVLTGIDGNTAVSLTYNEKFYGF